MLQELPEIHLRQSAVGISHAGAECFPRLCDVDEKLKLKALHLGVNLRSALKLRDYF